ncbi:hypothetical protein [Streptomyces sp. MZ04]|uniref:hypothetical protein n=1 Tax=Streptomyces sp. MZ04 TaxID=2559236 RepID=UPI001AE09FD3|nr:hypothetical protein [Streptomyces sp. MZ04]
MSSAGRRLRGWIEAAAPLPLESVQEAAARTRTVATGAVAGHADIAAVRDMVKLFMDMDEKHGGQHGRSAFVQYLVTDIADLCRGRFANGEVRSEVLSVASADAHLAGWKAYDSGGTGPGTAVLPPVPRSRTGLRHPRPGRLRDVHDVAAGHEAAPPRALPGPR